MAFPKATPRASRYLVYASAWLKCHHPAVFAAALLNSQPMGFYAPAQIVRDAQRARRRRAAGRRERQRLGLHAGSRSDIGAGGWGRDEVAISAPRPWSSGWGFRRAAPGRPVLFRLECSVFKLECPVAVRPEPNLQRSG